MDIEHILTFYRHVKRQFFYSQVKCFTGKSNVKCFTDKSRVLQASQKMLQTSQTFYRQVNNYLPVKNNNTIISSVTAKLNVNAFYLLVKNNTTSIEAVQFIS